MLVFKAIEEEMNQQAVDEEDIESSQNTEDESSEEVE